MIVIERFVYSKFDVNYFTRGKKVTLITSIAMSGIYLWVSEPPKHNATRMISLLVCATLVFCVGMCSFVYWNNFLMCCTAQLCCSVNTFLMCWNVQIFVYCKWLWMCWNMQLFCLLTDVFMCWHWNVQFYCLICTFWCVGM